MEMTILMLRSAYGKAYILPTIDIHVGIPGA
jgi:hypothetical protein